MSEVSCRVCAPLVRSVRELGLPADGLVDGLPYDLDYVAKPSHRLSWDHYVVLLDNSARLLGGAQALEDLCAYYYARTGAVMAALATSIGSARPLYHMGARWYGPSLYSNTRASCEDLPDGRLRQTIVILPGYRDSELFFRAMLGALRSVPCTLGQQPAKVELKLAPREGVFTIEPPPPLAPWERLRRLLGRRRVVERAEEELRHHHEELRRGYQRARSAENRLEAQTRRLEQVLEERERAERMLQQAQKLDAMGRLAGGISHDFNNVLTAIIGDAELALERLHPDDPVAAHLEEIRAVSERGAGLVKQILAFSRPQMTAPQTFDLGDLIVRMERMLRRLLPESAKLSLRTGERPLPIVADPGQIEQLVVNLVVNARDATAGGGRIELCLSRRDDGGAQGCAVLEVRDDGSGMDDATLARAFEPFFTTKPRGKGTGLGLATVYGIVKRLGGTVRLESRVRGGTTALVELPLAAGAALDAPLAPARREVAGGDETVLVVEDEDSVRGVLRRVLEARGYEVVVAADAEEALRIARTHAGPIQLLLTDVVLPAADGRDLAREIDSLREELRGVVFISGHAGDEAWSGDPPPGNHLLLHKPFAPAALLGAARRVLDA